LPFAGEGKKVAGFVVGKKRVFLTIGDFFGLYRCELAK
jgi:hypothetical protein